MLSLRRLSYAVGLGALVCAAPVSSARAEGAWVTAYYPSWELAYMPPGKIDMRPITHLVYFALAPVAGGRLNDTVDGLSGGVTTVRDVAHATGKKVLICIGGENSGRAFRGAINASSRATFVANIVRWITSHGYDGVDIDMEPVEASDAADYQTFIKALRIALRAADPKLLLTAALGASDDPARFLPLQNEFDQMNLMTYVFSGPWPGWVTWYDANLYNGGKRFPGLDKQMPAVDLYIPNWVKQGVTPARLGIGISFDASVWHGADGPGQSVAGVKKTDSSYHEVMDTAYSPAAYHWDKTAHAPYLSLATPEKRFITFDDERVCKEKIDYVHKNHLGGVILWEIAEQFRPGQPAGKQNPLLQAIYEAKP